MWNASPAVDTTQKCALKTDVVHRVDCKGCNTYYVGKPEKTLKGGYANIRELSGDEATLFIWMHTVETGHSFGFEKAKAIDHERFKGERLVEEALHSGPQAVNLCASLPVQYQSI